MLEFARTFREMNRWHTESQSFVGTRWGSAEGDVRPGGNRLLNWATGAWEGQWSNNAHLKRAAFPWSSHEPWVAYHDSVNKVKISYFPAVHDLNGSISYTLEWNGLVDPTSYNCQTTYAPYNPPLNPPDITTMLGRR